MSQMQNLMEKTFESKLTRYPDFVDLLGKIGFMPLTKNNLGLISLESVTTEDSWHVGDKETDPWKWKDRIVCDRVGIYLKLFAKRPGFISNEWFPYFFALYRNGEEFALFYEKGLYSSLAKDLYECIAQNGLIDGHELKLQLGITKESKSKFESALVELQTGFFVVIGNESRLISSTGREVSWPVLNYSTTEAWVGPELLQKAEGITSEEALEKIVSHVRELVPNATDKAIEKYLGIKDYMKRK